MPDCPEILLANRSDMHMLFQAWEDIPPRVKTEPEYPRIAALRGASSVLPKAAYKAFHAVPLQGRSVHLTGQPLRIEVKGFLIRARIESAFAIMGRLQKHMIGDLMAKWFQKPNVQPVMSKGHGGSHSKSIP